MQFKAGLGASGIECPTREVRTPQDETQIPTNSPANTLGWNSVNPQQQAAARSQPSGSSPPHILSKIDEEEPSGQKAGIKEQHPTQPPRTQSALSFNPFGSEQGFDDSAANCNRAAGVLAAPNTIDGLKAAGSKGPDALPDDEQEPTLKSTRQQ